MVLRRACGEDELAARFGGSERRKLGVRLDVGTAYGVGSEEATADAGMPQRSDSVTTCVTRSAESLLK